MSNVKIPLELDFDLIHVGCSAHLIFRQKDPSTGACLYQCPRCLRWFVFYEYLPAQQEAIPESSEVAPKKRSRKKKEKVEEPPPQEEPKNEVPEDYYLWRSEMTDPNSGVPIVSQINPKYLKSTEKKDIQGEEKSQSSTSST